MKCLQLSSRSGVMMNSLIYLYLGGQEARTAFLTMLATDDGTALVSVQDDLGPHFMDESGALTAAFLQKCLNYDLG